jgi:hypothetical protein
MHDQLPIADAINSIEQLTRIFRPLKRAEELCNTLRAAEGRLGELARAVSEGEEALVAVTSRVSECEARASATEAEAARRNEAAEARVRVAEAEASSRIAAAQARTASVTASAEAEAGEEMLRLDSRIADRRAELAELDRRVETANVTLAALRAKLG